jgi:hypothetical protein
MPPTNTRGITSGKMAIEISDRAKVAKAVTAALVIRPLMEEGLAFAGVKPLTVALFSV